MTTLRSALAALLAPLGFSSASAEQTNAPAVTPTPVRIESFAQGLEHPWAMQFLPDGRLLVTERPGRLRIIAMDGRLSPPVANVPAVAAVGQGGLLDVRLGEDFVTSGTIFLSFAEPRGEGRNGTSVARAKLVLEGDGGRLDDVRVIFRQVPAVESPYHFGSRIVPAGDGTLYVTLGERNFARQEAQNPANHIGKVVRITSDGAPAAANPKLPGWDPLVWSIGHRNIQGAALDPVTKQLWTVEHGAKGGDELNHPEAGKNYGWPVITYGRDYNGSPIGIGPRKEGMEQPVYYWDPSIATSGLTLYDGDLFPGWKGNFLVGGLAGRHVQRLVMRNGEAAGIEVLAVDRRKRIRDVRQGPDGAVWLLTDEAAWLPVGDPGGEVLRMTPATRP